MFDTAVSVLSQSFQAALPRYGGWIRVTADQLSAAGDSIAGLGSLGFETLPRFGGWLFASVEHLPTLHAGLGSLGHFAFQTLPRYGGWLGSLF